MKKICFTFLLFPILFILFSCSSKKEERTLVGESEIVTLPSGEKHYYPIARLSDLEDAVFLEEETNGETIHWEFDLSKKTLTKRKSAEHTTAIIYGDIQINTYLDVFDITSKEDSFTFIKIGPRILENKQGVRFIRVDE